MALQCWSSLLIGFGANILATKKRWAQTHQRRRDLHLAWAFWYFPTQRYGIKNLLLHNLHNVIASALLCNWHMLLPMLPMLPTSSHYAPTHITCSALTFLADSGIAFVKVSLGPMSKGSKRTSWLSELDRVAIAAIAFELNSVRCKVLNHDVWQWLRAYWPPVGRYLLQISLSWDWARLQGLHPVLAPQFAGPLHGCAWTSPLRPHPSSHPSLLPWFCPWKPVAPTGAHLSLEMQHLHQRSKVNRATCDSDALT